jgi:hypothetical protein
VNAWLKTGATLQRPWQRHSSVIKTHDARMRLINMQAAIEAVDRAIEDEQTDD